MPVTWNDHVELDCITSPRKNTSLFVSVGVPDIRCCAGSWYQDASSGKSTKVFESHPHFLGRLFGSWKYQNKDQPVLTLRSCFQHILVHRWWLSDRSSCGRLSCGGWVERSRFPKNSLENILLWGVPCVGRPILSFNCLWTWLGNALSQL